MEYWNIGIMGFGIMERTVIPINCRNSETYNYVRPC